MLETIKEGFEESIIVKRKIIKDDAIIAAIAQAAAKLIESYKKGGKLIIFGNGGSAADAQHISTELQHQFAIKRRKALPALSLSTNTSTLTAIGNDWGFAEVFSRQVEGLATDKDMVIGITTSGNSENVILGIQQAKKQGAFTIALTGKDGGKIRSIADLSIICCNGCFRKRYGESNDPVENDRPVHLRCLRQFF